VAAHNVDAKKIEECMLRNITIELLGILKGETAKDEW
jgi:hypothetical protein